jgi:hypothetical protein
MNNLPHPELVEGRTMPMQQHLTTFDDLSQDDVFLLLK